MTRRRVLCPYVLGEPRSVSSWRRCAWRRWNRLDRWRRRGAVWRR